MNEKHFKKVIEELDNEFDSHKFIEKFMSMYEKEYVELLCSHINSSGIFRAAHAQIGKFLSDKSSLFEIEKNDRVDSQNIKKYDNENQNWRKTL